MTIKSLQSLASALQIEIGDLFPQTDKGAMNGSQVKACCEALREQVERQRLAIKQMDLVVSELEAPFKP